jgi:hypothetical protein
MKCGKEHKSAERCIVYSRKFWMDHWPHRGIEENQQSFIKLGQILLRSEDDCHSVVGGSSHSFFNLF